MKHLKTLTVICFFLVYVINAQDNKIQLRDLLQDIENQFSVKFSYTIDDVNGVTLKKPIPFKTLPEYIAFLNANTLLNFKAIDSRYITVSVIDKKITVCGYVIDKMEQLPLPSATVSTLDKRKGVITGFNGKFVLENVNVNAILEISFLGYKKLKVAAKTLLASNTCASVFLENKNTTLSPVLITKYLTTGLQKKIDGSTVLKTNEFGILPGLIDPDVLESIQVLPGVESQNESIADINVRGGTNDQNLILWDGIKMYHSGHFFGLISAYNPYLTERVEVTKNGTSSAFSDGVSSSINMFTKNKINKTINGGVGVNLISADAFIELPLTRNLAVHVSGRRSLTSLVETPTYKNYFNRSFQDSDIRVNETDLNTNDAEFLFYDYTAKVLFNASKSHKLRANIIGITNALDYFEFSEEIQEKNTRASVLKQENIGAGGSWEASWTSKFKTSFSGYYSKYRVNANDFDSANNQNVTQVNEVLETGVKLNTVYSFNPYLSFLNGYQFNETGILNKTQVRNPDYLRNKKDVLLNHAAYSELEYQKRNTFFRLGIRVNYFQKFKLFLTEPRLNFRQKLNNQLAVKILGEFKNQTVTQIIDFQNDFLGVERRRWVLANDNDIPITKSKQLSLGVDYSANNWHVDVLGFYKNVNNITVKNQAFYNDFRFGSETGDYTVKGLEFLLNKTGAKYSAWFSYTYSENNYDFRQFIPSQFANSLDVRHSMSAAGNYTLAKGLKLSLGVTWHSGVPFTKPVFNEETSTQNNVTVVNYDIPNSSRLSPFFRADASVSYQFIDKKRTKGSFRIGVKNITNQFNVINRYYKVNPNDSSKAIEINNTSLPLTPNASLRISF